jgi:altronate hydrolase
MSTKFLKIHPADNVYVALTDLKAGENISAPGLTLTLPNDVQAKHKFVETALKTDDEITMYGCLQGAHADSERWRDKHAQCKT